MLTPQDLGLPASRFPRYRRGQDTIAIKLAESETRFSAISAPPGIGKTLIYISAAQLLGMRTLVLTTSKNLQSQLVRDFAEIGLYNIVGHSNYPCAIRGGWELSEYGCKVRREECNYHSVDVPEGQNASIVSTNYHHWIALQKVEQPDRLGNFDLIVMDEAHEAINILSEMLSITLTQYNVRTLLDCSMPDKDSGFYSWVLWARSVLPRARQLYAKLRKDETTDKETMARIYRLGKDLAFLSRVTKTESWIVESQNHVFKLSPVWATQYVEDYLFRGVQKVILSSGTLSRFDAEKLGIAKSDLQFLDIPLSFVVNRKPFIHVPTTRVSHDMTRGQKRQIVSRIDQLIKYRPDSRGIIHSRSYDYRDTVLQMTEHKDLFISHESGEVAAAVERFRNSIPPKVLISPAIEEGVDFIGPLAMYGVLLKTPFLDKRTPLAKARVAEDSRYGISVTSRKVVQAVLRIFRDQWDWRHKQFFTFDDHWFHFRKTGDFPLWFKRTFTTMDSIPKS